MTKNPVFNPLFAPKHKSAKSIADLLPNKPGVKSTQPTPPPPMNRAPARPLAKSNLGALALIANPNVKKLLIILGILLLLVVVYYWLQAKPAKKKETIEDQIRSYKKLLKKK